MNYKRILISEAEKKRILGMHDNRKKNPTTNNFLFEEDENTTGEKAGEKQGEKAGEKAGESQLGGPAQKEFPSCVSEKKGYKTMTGQQIKTDFSEDYSCLKQIDGKDTISTFLLDNLKFMVSTYGGQLIIYDISGGKVKIVCTKDGNFKLYPWACKCIAGKYKPSLGKEITVKDYFDVKAMPDDSEKDCKPLSGDEVIKDKNCKNLSPYQVVTNLGLNWRETRDKWVENGCNGTTPCIKGDARTNINLRSAICDGTYDPRNPQKGGTTPGDQAPGGDTDQGKLILVDPTNPRNSKMNCFFKKLVELKIISRIPVNYKFPSACSTTQAANVLPDDNNLKTCFIEMIGVVAPYLVNIELVQIKVIIIEILVCIFGSEDKIPPVLINLPIEIPGKGKVDIKLPDNEGEDWDQWRGGLFPIKEKPEGPPTDTPPRTAG